MDRTTALQASSDDTVEHLSVQTVLLTLAILVPGVAALYFLSSINYLMFHGLVELSSVVVAVTTFSIGWHSRHFSRNDSFILLAVAYLAVGGLDLFHTLSYKGMGVFPTAEVDAPTQFWISARSLQAGAYLVSGLLLDRNQKTGFQNLSAGFLVVGALLALAIWPLKVFPSCLTEEGLTPFKIGAEYVISVVLAVSAWLYWRGRAFLDKSTTTLMLGSIGLAILSELAFTLYQDVYGLANCTGHLLKVGSVFLTYRALVQGALRNPYQSLFRSLTLSHQALDQELEQRRQTEKQLRAANRELDSFVHTVAHDLRSPLTVFISGTEFLRRQLQHQVSESLLQLLDGIEEKGWQMTRLLEDLLKLARIGRLDTPPEKVDAAVIATQVTSDLQQEISATDTRVNIEKLPALQAHGTLIYLLLANLIGNAVRYAGGPERPITVGGQRTARQVRFYVRDHGPGISAKDKEQLGELFFRGENAKNNMGTGIGLTIVQKIANYYRGRFWVEDTPGGGATFWVELQEPEGRN